jgi:spermidine synthase
MRIQYTPVDHEATPLGEIALVRYQAETGEIGYEVRLNDAFLMASHGAAGEHAMARLAWQRLAPAGHGLHVLVGGLGAGQTLCAALGLPRVSRVDVVELSAKVVAWNKTYFAETNGRALDDPRVTVEVADLARALPRYVGELDLLLLDVDNGPGWLAAQANAALYQHEGVRVCGRALRPGGVLAVWSPEPNATFRATLTQAFACVEELSVTEGADGAPALRDVVYVARGPS